MRVLVVHDGQGKIVSLTEHQITGAGQPWSQPVAREGQAVAELDVPEEHAHLSLELSLNLGDGRGQAAAA